MSRGTKLVESLAQVGLTVEEYELIVRSLGREPNIVELGMFGALWSEHCGYKHTKPLLKLLPTQAPWVLQGPGENAGVVDIGDGLAVVMKIESHNHPSAVEPFQGAATGVGGILRDIFTMGARPIAILDSLRFGPLSEPRNRYLMSGVVAGIGWYGNCIGVPTVGGEVYFAPSYSQNPLVNAMCVGLIQVKKLVRAQASGPGNILLLVGADTGRDGILGASFASAELGAETEEKRPAVQVGNPFLEKLLIEACLEVLDKAGDWVVGLQDLGAAGITAAVVEAASRAGTGAEIDIAKVSRREEGMNPYEVMLSESQERMLVAVRRGGEEKVRAIFNRWGLHSDVIGYVTDDGLVQVKEGAQTVAELPVQLLTTPPVYLRQGERPAYLAELHRFDPHELPPTDPNEALLKLLSSPNIASKEWVYRQYDHMNLTNTLLGPEAADAAVLRVKGTKKAIALTTDGNGRYCYLEPYLGGAIAVAEAARNLACVGARPLAITDCLNFGNPEKPTIYYQLEQTIKGMADACQALGVPVVSGNVSLYNETEGQAVWPTPVVGMLGLLDEAHRRCGMAFQEEGDLVALLGPLGEELGGSAYVATLFGLVAGPPPKLDLAVEAKVQSVCLKAVEEGLVKSAHDCSDGGLAVAVAESAIAGGQGAVLDSLPASPHPATLLFGEAQSRVVLSLAPPAYPRLAQLCQEAGVPLCRLGAVGGTRLIIGPWINQPLVELAAAWRGALPSVLGDEQYA